MERNKIVRPRILPVALALLASVLAPSAPLRAADEGDALSLRLTAIERAFRAGDAADLRSSASSSAKIRVILPRKSEGSGSFGASQFQVVFERIFQENRTREFTLRRSPASSGGEGTVFAKARWVHEPRSGQSPTEDSLTFTLRLEGDEWRIHEIRSSRS